MLAVDHMPQDPKGMQEKRHLSDETVMKIRRFSKIRNFHFQLVDGLNLLLYDPKVQNHMEFPLQIESLKRSGAFMVMHANENYNKFGRRLEDVNEDMLVLTSYIVRHLCLNQD
uniref:PRORP domain-containing protein n=1 Tax=Caenorhabditis tropicalis TaxID=1561998 RepID=A0A1I7U165_9PELO